MSAIVDEVGHLATVWATGCRSWYLDEDGIPAAWPWTFDRFHREMAAPALDAYERVGSGTVLGRS